MSRITSERALSKNFRVKTVMTAVMTLLAITFFIGLSFLYKESGTASANETSGTFDNLTWSYDSSDGTLTISGTGEMTDYDVSNNVPWNSYKNDIKIVNIESGVTSIGKNAFNSCSGLTSITISDTVTSIGDYAFFAVTTLQA